MIRLSGFVSVKKRPIQICFKVHEGTYERMEREIERHNKGTRAEFLNDAVKFYLDYLENKHLEEWKMQNESPQD
jgi:hypothetical protein